MRAGSNGTGVERRYSLDVQRMHVLGIMHTSPEGGVATLLSFLSDRLDRDKLAPS